MGQQKRTLRQGSLGSGSFITDSPLTANSSGVVTLPNYGVSLLTSGGEYVLDTPGEAGTRKYLVCVSSSSLATVIRGSTGTSVKFNNNGATQIAFTASSTVDRCVELMAINSTRWTVINVHPYTTDSLSPSVATS